MTGEIISSTEDTITVAMEDGTQRAFSKKRKLQKESSFNPETGEVTTRFFWVNGSIFTFSILPTAPLYLKFLAHGIEAKLGDAANDKSIKTVDDAVAVVRNLADLTLAGTWNPGRTSNGESSPAADNLTLQALSAVAGVPIEQLQTITQAKIAAGEFASLQSAYAAYRSIPGVKTKIAELQEAKETDSSSAALLAALKG